MTTRGGVIGWDVGGAHLKAAYLAPHGGLEQVIHLPCPLWRGLSYLEQAIEEVLLHMSWPAPSHAVTMTGELADLFPNRPEGVRQLVLTISHQMDSSIGRQSATQKLRFYGGRRGFLEAGDAIRLADDVASANWLASARYVASLVGDGVFIDIGSTTTDIVAFKDGRICARGYRDHERLRCEELVYTGVVRTPIMALTDKVPIGGDWVPLMAENFATSGDIYRVLQLLPISVDQADTADGTTKSVEDSARRLARMVGCDVERMPLERWVGLAQYLQEVQLKRIQGACERVLSLDLFQAKPPLIGAGAGHFLVERLADRLDLEYRNFSEVAGIQQDAEEASACAAAIAVAGLLGQTS